MGQAVVCYKCSKQYLYNTSISQIGFFFLQRFLKINKHFFKQSRYFTGHDVTQL